MSDDEILVGSGEPVAPPAEHRPTPAPPSSDPESRQQTVLDQFNKGLMLNAHGTEDATDYARERETQGKFIEGQDISPAQMREWHERASASLQRAIDAQARARGEVPPSQQSVSEENIPGYVPPDDPNYDAIIDANRARFSEYFDNPENIGSQNTAAEHKKAVMDWITTYDSKSVLIGHFMASPLGPQMMEALEGQGEIIQYLANLPPQVRAGEMKKFEGYLAAKEEMKQQQAALQEPQTHVRKFTQAPEPIRPPRGGANPPKDLHGLARKENVADYVRLRMEQERRREDW